MAKTQTRRKPTKEIHKTSKTNNTHHQLEPKKLDKPPPPPSWVVMKSILTCKHLQVDHHQQQQHPHDQKQKQKKLKQKQPQEGAAPIEESSITNKKTNKKMRCTTGAGSLCNNTKVMQRPAQQQHRHPIDHSTNSPDPLLFIRRSVKPSSSSTSSSSSLMSISAAGSNSINDNSNRSLTSGGGSSSATTTSSSSYSVTSHNPLGGSGGGSSGNTGGGGSTSSFKGIPFRRLSGCYECRMVVDPVLGFTKDPSLRATICTCPDCGEIFMKPDYLELHQATRHAVSELGPEDTSKNIVEIIFQSSWLRKQPTPAPICKIERILKVHNTTKTISKFEEYRCSIKSKAQQQQQIPAKKQYPRCVADGNELLRFHCTSFMCSLGLNGSSNLCNQIPNCNVCSIIRNGFRVVNGGGGILTTATSGRAHDRAEEEGSVVEGSGAKRAMLVCRVIAGRVKKSGSVEGGGGSGVVTVAEEFDSVAGAAVLYSNLDELYVFNPRAILPCFVVVYKGF